VTVAVINYQQQEEVKDENCKVEKR